MVAIFIEPEDMSVQQVDEVKKTLKITSSPIVKIFTGIMFI